ncbi:MAG: hypothetical protein P9M03_05825 [Candidatus Theseobacter exili]|nr:hypothetical protein [Candidatus Theseobacter exili]
MNKKIARQLIDGLQKKIDECYEDREKLRAYFVNLPHVTNADLDDIDWEKAAHGEDKEIKQMYDLLYDKKRRKQSE